MEIRHLIVRIEPMQRRFQKSEQILVFFLFADAVVQDFGYKQNNRAFYDVGIDGLIWRCELDFAKTLQCTLISVDSFDVEYRHRLEVGDFLCGLSGKCVVHKIRLKPGLARKALDDQAFLLITKG